MEVVQLKEIVPDNLLSARYAGQQLDEFHRLMDEWTDTEYLFDFFTENSHLLFSGFYKNVNSVEDAISLTMDEADRFNEMLLECDQNGTADLDTLFKPLHRHSINIVRQESKLYGPRKPSWLRLYAIRIAANYYAISGGAIKLTKTMQEAENNEEHFIKLKALASFIKENRIEDADDYTYLDVEFQ